MNPQALMQFLQNPNPQMLEQAATQLAQQGVPAPPPGFMQQIPQQLYQAQGMQQRMPSAPPTGIGAMLGGPRSAPPPVGGLGSILQGQAQMQPQQPGPMRPGLGSFL